MTDIQEVKSERGLPGLESGKYKVFVMNGVYYLTVS